MRPIVALLLLLSTVAAGSQEPPAKKALRIPLSKTSVRKGILRPGASVTTEIPVTAYQAKVGGEAILFFDLDGDEKLAPDTDGMALQYGPFVVHVTDTLLLKTGQYKVAFEDLKTLLLTPDDLGPWESLVADASVMTEIRVRTGLRPAALDVKACAACDLHCTYLKLNKINDGSAGLKSHTEEQGKPGYTPEGAAAGGGGDIYFGSTSLKVAIDGWYRSVWHAVPIVDPSMSRFGAAMKFDCGTLYFSANGFRGSSGKGEYPPDGATNIPRGFGEAGENPNPVPGTQGGKGCGIPVFVRYGPTPETFTLADPTGRAVPGTVSSPTKPANPEWPTNSGVTCFIPSKLLAPMTTYKATLKPLGGGESIVWSFTTGSR